ncbi:MAG: fimbrillin family protein [Muribaculaceae bacterium]|nr:fimbrillin family protein [Muribaculaceae bacterium]
MKKNLFWAASIACLCASCANDAVIEENRASDEIRFRAFAEGSTRADAVYCPSNLPEEFNVYATDADNNLIIDGDLIKLESGAYVNKTAQRYWPESGTLTFEALLNGSKESDGTVNFSVADAAASQKDLIYARATGSKADGTVALNFRHALSQIVFKAKNTNETLTVKVSKVELCNVNNSGVYTLPSDNTTDNSGETDHDGTTYQTAGRGSWNSLEGNTSYTIENEVILNSETTSADISAANGSDALMLIPNTYTAWDATTAINDATEGTYFLVTATITQKVNDNETAVKIWDGEIAIPVAFSWVEGKRYIYTFAFGQGNGGYDPENPENPVFVPITFSVDVDEFVPASEVVEAGGK